MIKFKDFEKNYTFKGFREEQFEKDSNKFLKLKGNHVSEDGNNAVIRIASSHIIPTQFGYAVIMNEDTVFFIKRWQVWGQARYSDDYIINFNRDFFAFKKWGDHSDLFGSDMSFKNFDDVVKLAKEQEYFYNNPENLVTFNRS